MGVVVASSTASSNWPSSYFLTPLGSIVSIFALLAGSVSIKPVWSKGHGQILSFGSVE